MAFKEKKRKGEKDKPQLGPTFSLGTFPLLTDLWNPFVNAPLLSFLLQRIRSELHHEQGMNPDSSGILLQGTINRPYKAPRNSLRVSFSHLSKP